MQSCPKENERAPDFELYDDEGKLFTLSSLRGRKVLLYFYPKAMTRGCTIEALNFKNSYSEIKSLGCEIVGVSKDSIDDIRKFKSMYGLPFKLLADPEGKVIQMYCVRGFGNRARRVSFLIDENGVIIKIWKAVDPSIHHNEVVEELSKLVKEK